MTTRKWLIAALAVAAAVGGWRLWVLFFDQPGTAELLVNRLWIERAPRNPRDLIRQVVVLRRGERQVGVTARGSQWRVQAEGFLWRLEGEDQRLVARFPQDNRKASFEVRAWRCAGQVPKPFELCLEIGRGGRSRRLYSRTEWVVRSEGGGVNDDRDVAWMAPTWDFAAHTPTDDGSATVEAAPDYFPFD